MYNGKVTYKHIITHKKVKIKPLATKGPKHYITYKLKITIIHTMNCIKHFSFTNPNGASLFNELNQKNKQRQSIQQEYYSNFISITQNL